MAEESKIVSTKEVPVETSDRGLFDFMGKKEETKPNEEVIATELEKVHVSEPYETKVDEEKKKGIFDKLHQSTSSSSSSSSDEEEGENGEKKKKKKKGLKEEKKDENDNSVPIEKYEVPSLVTPAPEEKKGFLEKMKEKLPGQQKKPVEEISSPAPAPVVVESAEPKKGILEKIKEKLPGYHTKTHEEEKEKEKEKETH